MNKIIVVEDNESLARGLVYALEKEGWLIELATNIMEFDQKYLEQLQEFDLVILDVMLPDGNGFDLFYRIKEAADIPVIFLTACDAEVNVVLGLDMGADDYITKPFRIRELISRIRVVLRRNSAKAPTSRMLISKDLSLDLGKMKLFKLNAEIALSPSEYKLIVIFMENPEILLDRNTILSRLWDSEGQFIDDNTLSVYISRLREKIEEDASNPEYIITVRGLGYKWNQRSRRLCC